LRTGRKGDRASGMHHGNSATAVEALHEAAFEQSLVKALLDLLSGA
jgi:hypothetical protein